MPVSQYDSKGNAGMAGRIFRKLADDAMIVSELEPSGACTCSKATSSLPASTARFDSSLWNAQS